MSKQLIRNALAAVLISLVAGIASAASVVVTIRPPAPRVEVRSASPSASHVWVAGHWKWNGKRWLWVDGSWKRKPAPGSRWVAGHWKRHHGGWLWVPGHWRR
jgi:hypothetical protein